jgi:hypothetical protein
MRIITVRRNFMIQSPKQFWQWFEQNNKAYLFLNEVDAEKKEQLLSNLMERLHEYCENLWFEIGGHPDEDQELIITAEGNAVYFGHVEALINAAPKIPNWTFIAFIPPREVDFEMKYEDVELKPSEMWFEPLEHPNNAAAIGIKVCTRNFELVKASEWLRPAVHKILDTILGEKTFALDIEHVAIDQLPDEPEEEGLIQLSQLAAFVRWKKSKQTDRTESSA